MQGLADPPASPTTAVRALLDRLEEVRPTSTSAVQADEDGQGELWEKVEGLHRALKKCVDEPTSLYALSSFSELLRNTALDFPLPSLAVVSAASGSSTSASKEKKEEGSRLKVFWEVVGGVIRWVVDEAIVATETGLEEKVDKERKNREEVLVAVLEGLQNHLNDHSDETEAKTYRTFLGSHLLSSLTHVVLPDSSSIPTSSTREVDDGRPGTGIPIEGKYLALAVLGELMSKNEENKEKLRELIPAETLGRLLAHSLNSHISRLLLELIFRLTPVRVASSRSSSSSAFELAEKQVARNDYLSRVFQRDWFGDDYDSLREKYEAIKTKDWDEGAEKLIVKITMSHIRRPQPFAALSLSYNNRSLLSRQSDSDGSTPSSSSPVPTLDEIKAGAYEKKTVWISRHIIGAIVDARQLVVDSQGEEDYEHRDANLVVEMGAVERVHVEDLGEELDLARITALLSSTSPLRLDRHPHPSSPSHVGRSLASAHESQVSAAVPKLHKLEMIMPAKGSNLSVLKKTLEDRAQRYDNLGKELAHFPKRVFSNPSSAQSTTAWGSGFTSAPPSKAAPSTTGAVASTSTGIGAKHVTFGPSPFDKPSKPQSTSTASHFRTRAPQKASQAAEPVEQVFPSSAATVGSGEGEEEEDQRDSQNSVELARRAEEAAKLARLDEMSRTGSSEVGGSDTGAEGGGGKGDDPGFQFYQDEGEHGYGGGYDEPFQPAAAVAEEEQDDDLPRPSQVGGMSAGRSQRILTSDDPLQLVTAATGKAKETPAAGPPPSKADKGKGKERAPSAAPVEEETEKEQQMTRSRASTIGKPRPAKEEDVTPSQRALARRESAVLAEATKEEKVKKKEGKKRTVSSELSELTEQEEEEEGGEEEGDGLAYVPPKGNEKATSSAASKPKDDKLSVPASKTTRRRSPRLSSPAPSDVGKGDSTTSARPGSKTVKNPPPPAASKKVLPSATEDQQQQVSTTSTTSGRPRRTAAKKVAEALKPGSKQRSEGSKKRTRETEESEPDDKEEGASEEKEEEEYVEKGKKGKGKGKKSAANAKQGKEAEKAPTAKVVKMRKTFASSSIKVVSAADSAAADQDEQGEETDYDSYPVKQSLEPKREVRSPARRYGKERKVVKSVGGKRKAGQRGKGGKTDEESTAGLKPFSRAKRRKKDEEDDQEEGAAGKRTTRSMAKGKIVVKGGEGESTSGLEDIENLRPTPSPQPSDKPVDKRVSDDLFPPFDLTSPLKKSPVRHALPAEIEDVGSRETTPRPPAKQKKFESLSQLMRQDEEPGTDLLSAHTGGAAVAAALPADDDQAFGVDHPTDVHAGYDEQEYGGGYEQPDFGADIANIDTPFLRGRQSFSPLLDPTKDLSAIDRAFPSNDSVGPRQEGTVDSALLLSAKQVEQPVETQPRVLVEDTQSDAAPTPKKLGAHVVGEKAVEEEKDVEMAPAEDVEQEQVEIALEAVRGDERQHLTMDVDVEQPLHKEEEAEQADTDDLYSVANGGEDDSGKRFEAPLDRGIEGDEEEMAQPGADLVDPAAEDASSERLSDRSRAQRHPSLDGATASSSKKPVSAPHPSASSVRPLLVEKPPHRPSSADSAASPPRPAPEGITAARPLPLPVASTLKARLPAAPSAQQLASGAPARKPAPPSAALSATAGPGSRSAAVVQPAFPPHPAKPQPVAPQPVLFPPGYQKPPLAGPTAAKTPHPVPILRSSRSRPSIASTTAATGLSSSTSKKKRTGAVNLLSSPSPRVSFAPPPVKQRTRSLSFNSAQGVPFAPLPFQARSVIVKRGSLAGGGGKKTGRKGKAGGGGVKEKRKEKGKGKAVEVEVDQREQADGVEGMGDGWDSEDDQLYEVFDQFSRLLVEKNRLRRSSLHKHHQSSVFRLDKELGKYLMSVHSDSQTLLAHYSSYVSATEDASNPQSMLSQVLVRAREINAKLWGEAEGELRELRKG
ncbi:hypothetical protein JCM8547_000615 [Rhodosporidiobolus lusitaniae]